YFIDENCSYRLLSLLEVVRPSSNLLSGLSAVVLPADTVRVLIENGLVAATDSTFRSSILRRLNRRVRNFSKTEYSAFERSKESLDSLNEVQSVSVLDALIDYWTYTNYRAETKLTRQQSQLMEQAFLLRSKNPIVG